MQHLDWFFAQLSCLSAQLGTYKVLVCIELGHHSTTSLSLCAHNLMFFGVWLSSSFQETSTPKSLYNVADWILWEIDYFSNFIHPYNCYASISYVFIYCLSILDFLFLIFWKENKNSFRRATMNQGANDLNHNELVIKHLFIHIWINYLIHQWTKYYSKLIERKNLYISLYYSSHSSNQCNDAFWIPLGKLSTST